MDRDLHRLAGAGPAPGGAAPLPGRIVEEAVAWYVCLASGQETPQDRAGFERWLASHEDHALAWQRLQGIGQQLRGTRRHLAPALTRSTLKRAAQADAPRRRVLKTLAWAGAGGAALALALAQHDLSWRTELSAALADERTRAGERRRLVLADGTGLMLNTDTAVEIRFDARERRVLLRSGEIQVATAHDAAGRPFIVRTQEGSLLPVGTRFTVRRDAGLRHLAAQATRLAVSEGMVEVHPAGAPSAAPVRVAAGQQLTFSAHDSSAVEPADEAGQAWTDGVLVAERSTLADFVAELERYRAGRLRCAPEVAQLRITGTWPLEGSDPTDRILASLERQLPVVVHRLTRYWVTVQAR